MPLGSGVILEILVLTVISKAQREKREGVDTWEVLALMDLRGILETLVLGDQEEEEVSQE